MACLLKIKRQSTVTTTEFTIMENIDEIDIKDLSEVYPDQVDELILQINHKK